MICGMETQSIYLFLIIRIAKSQMGKWNIWFKKNVKKFSIICPPSTNPNETGQAVLLSVITLLLEQL